MRGIPEIHAVIERNGKNGCVAFCRLDTRTQVRMSVHVDCSIDAGATDANRSVAPDHANYAARGYSVQQAAVSIFPVVRYPRCAGWHEGFGSCPAHAASAGV
jgi:hypothetical protein